MLKYEAANAERRAAEGKAQRTLTPRAAHCEWIAGADRADPLALIDASARGRLAGLLPIRNARMNESAFSFFRGSAVVMAADLARTPSTGFLVQADGDAHCLNFGGFATPERNVIFDLNDFDETLPGPWEWDVKRLATSIMLAGRDNGLKKRASALATLSAVRAYRTRMHDLAAMPALEVWYARLDACEILDDATNPRVRRSRSRIVEHAVTEPIRTVVEKLTYVADGVWRFRDDPPVLFHSEETDRAGFDIEGILADYATSLPDDVAHLFARYTLLDCAIKVVGVGSVGTRCGIALLAADDHDPLLLQIKEARPSVLEAYLPKSAYANHGERVVRGQRLMQTASDAFLGWASSGSHHFYVRQFKDMKSSANLAGVNDRQLREYAQYCAYALAAAHARSGHAASIAGYLGQGSTFDRAVLEFADSYADQAERDYQRFNAAIAEGDVAAA